jgi:hypothetical protein
MVKSPPLNIYYYHYYHYYHIITIIIIGKTWQQIFCHQKPDGDEKIKFNGTVNACAVSYDGYSFALGFTGGDLYVIHDCSPADDIKSCEASWRPQNTTITGDHDTRGVALSIYGSHFYSVDAGTMEIASGVLEASPTPDPTSLPTPSIPTIYIPTIWSPSPYPTSKPSGPTKLPTPSPTPSIPTIYVPTIWSPTPFPTKKPTK